MSLHLKNSRHVENKYSMGESDKCKKDMFANKYRMASLLMGLLICLMGLVFSTVEPIKACNFSLKVAINFFRFKYFNVKIKKVQSVKIL